MFTTSTDLLLASMGMSAVAVVMWGQRRRSYHALADDRSQRCSGAWTELQQRCIALVEQDERGGADAEGLQRAVARYHAVIGESGDFVQGERQVPGPKQIPAIL